MGKEIEKRFFKYNKKEIVDKILNELNGKYKGMRLFKVWKFKIPKSMNSDIHTLRVRDEENKKTFTIKKKGGKEKYDTEYEVNIQDPNEMIHMLSLMNFKLDHYYEKMREIYNVGRSEIIFDIYPGMTDSMEVESTNQKILTKMMKKLGLKDDEDDKKVDIDFYKYYGIKGGFDSRIGKCKNGYTFKNVYKNRDKYATQNKEEFKNYVKKQLSVLDKLNKDK